MFSYENGLLVSFFLYCYYIFNLILTLNSTAEQNLNKVGERHSWLSLKPKLMDSSDFDRPFIKKIGKFIFVVVWHGLFVFLSWFNVCMAVGYIFYIRYIDSGAPKAVKEFRWKLRNLDMTFDEICLELIKVKGLELEDFDAVKLELIEFINERRIS